MSFTDRMAAGRELAQVARNRGIHTGKSAVGWHRRRQMPAANDNVAWLQAWRREWKLACREIVTEYNSRCLNPANDQPEQWEL